MGRKRTYPGGETNEEQVLKSYSDLEKGGGPVGCCKDGGCDRNIHEATGNGSFGFLRAKEKISTRFLPSTEKSSNLKMWKGENEWNVEDHSTILFKMHNVGFLLLSRCKGEGKRAKQKQFPYGAEVFATQ